MTRKPRKPYTAEETVTILRRHLLEQVPVSDLGDEYHLHPTQFYRWQRQFFANGAAALAGSSHSATAALEAEIAALEAKLARQHEVLSELMEEYVRLDYNTMRLHSAIGYLTPKDKLEGRAELIFAERDRKLEAARQTRRQRRAALIGASTPNTSVSAPPPPQEIAS